MGEGGSEASGSKLTASYEAVGGRQRFTLELRPGETTIVSWKKLLKDATTNTNTKNASKPNNGPTPSSHQLLPPPAQLATGKVLENQAGEVPPISRLSTVIEKIESLYTGKASSDEEDLNNNVVPDDDDYDTEDSFIDDAELDEYFQVDNSAIKHDGFFVNRGKLERVEPLALPNHQPKKRRRKESTKDDVRSNTNKRLKVEGKKAVKSVPEDVKITTSENNRRKKSADNRSSSEATSSGVSSGAFLLQERDIASKNIKGKMKDNSSSEKDSYALGKLLNNLDKPNTSILQREKGDTNVTETKNACQVSKVTPIQRKEGSSVRPKNKMLERALREVEKLVSESRPPPVELHDVDFNNNNNNNNNTSPAVKKRLPPEIKNKLAKVARLAQATHGKITKELLDRLMVSVGHMIQIRSLKRNLEIMVSVGLSAKQEKDKRVNQIKKEVAEMVTTQIPLMKTKALEEQGGTCGDEKESLNRNYSMDDGLEDMLCNLYDVYVEGLEEDSGAQVRKLYAELAAMWPSGFMNNHEIKRAICRAKDRRRALQSQLKGEEKMKMKMKMKQVVVPKTEESVYSSTTHDNKSISSTSASVSATEQMKQDKGSLSIYPLPIETKPMDVMTRKKVKRTPSVELNPEKQLVVPLPEKNIQPAAPDLNLSS